MNADEVCAMIDAIVEGKPFQRDWDGARESDMLRIRTTPDMLTFTSNGMLRAHEITDPRIAREIAGALIAWADVHHLRSHNPQLFEKQPEPELAPVPASHKHFRAIALMFEQKAYEGYIKEQRAARGPGVPIMTEREYVKNLRNDIRIPNGFSTDQFRASTTFDPSVNRLRQYTEFVRTLPAARMLDFDYPNARTHFKAIIENRCDDGTLGVMVMPLHDWPESLDQIYGPDRLIAHADHIEVVEYDDHGTCIRNVVLKSRNERTD